MKILLDECVPWPMHKILIGHDCKTAQQCGWGGIKNGDLLKRAEPEFEIFITSDQNIRYQQTLPGDAFLFSNFRRTNFAASKTPLGEFRQRSQKCFRASSGN